jgi:ParB-like chromosome segregation protein Spo0J
VISLARKRRRADHAGMLERQDFPIAEIYIPADKRKGLDPARVAALAEAILEEGQKTPISVRQGNGRYVLVEGAHRLEALKALGEEVVVGFMVQARRR